MTTPPNTPTELEQWRDDMLRSIDKDIDGILETPDKYTKLAITEGGTVYLEESLKMLLAYRYLYRWRRHDWTGLIHEVNPEFFSFAEMCEKETTYDQWCEHAKKGVEFLREKYEKPLDQIVAEMIERVHNYDEDDKKGDKLIDDLYEFADVSLGRMADHFYEREQAPAPDAPLLNRIMEGVDVTKASSSSGFYLLVAGNTLQAQLPEWGPYRDRFLAETLKRELAGNLDDSKTPGLLSGFLEAHNYRWLIENDPDRAEMWSDMAKRYRVSLEIE